MRDNYGNYFENIGDHNHISLNSTTKIQALTNINDLAEQYVYADVRLKEERRARGLKNGIPLIASLLFTVAMSVYLWLKISPDFSLQDHSYIDALKQFRTYLLTDLASFFISLYSGSKLVHETDIEIELRKIGDAAKDRARLITPKKKWKHSWKEACNAARKSFSNAGHNER